MIKKVLSFLSKAWEHFKDDSIPIYLGLEVPEDDNDSNRG